MVGVKIIMKHLPALFCTAKKFPQCGLYLQEAECLVGFSVVVTTIPILHLLSALYWLSKRVPMHFLMSSFQL